MMLPNVSLAGPKGWYNISNSKILRDLHTLDLSICKHIDVYFTTFDTFELMTNLDPDFEKGIITVKHYPRIHDVKDGSEWSFFYDEHIKTNTKLHLKYEETGSSYRKKYFSILDKYYNPHFVINRDLAIIKSIIDILRYNNVSCKFNRPWKKVYIPDLCDWFDTGDHNDLILQHPLSYILKEIPRTTNASNSR